MGGAIEGCSQGPAAAAWIGADIDALVPITAVGARAGGDTMRCGAGRSSIGAATLPGSARTTGMVDSLAAADNALARVGPEPRRGGAATLEPLPCALVLAMGDALVDRKAAPGEASLKFDPVGNEDSRAGDCTAALAGTPIVEDGDTSKLFLDDAAASAVPQVKVGAVASSDSPPVPVLVLDGATNSGDLATSSVGTATRTGAPDGAMAEPGSEVAASTGAGTAACGLGVRSSAGAVAEADRDAIEAVEEPTCCLKLPSSVSFCLGAMRPGELITPRLEASRF
jgi:hypothetical protein